MSFNTRHISRLQDHTALLAGAVMVSLVSIGFAKLADWSIKLNHFLWHHTPWLVLIALPFGLVMLRQATKRFAPMAGGSGIPQTIAALMVNKPNQRSDSLLNWRQGMLKIIFVCLGLVLGASIGREGPSVQVGAIMMLYWGRYFVDKQRVSDHALIVAGAAGGLAAAFNTPLAGIIFAMEELAKGKGMRINWFVMAAILGAGFVALALQGGYDFFPIYIRSPHIPNVFVMALCAVLCGLLAGLMVRSLLMWFPALFRKFAPRSMADLVVAFVIGFAISVLAYLSNGKTLGTGYEYARELLNNQATENVLNLVAKYLATALSYVMGIPGGLFTPSLSIGASIGSWLNHVLGFATDQQFLVLIGMTAFLAGVTRAPITASVVVMEMSSSQTQFLYLMLAATLANLSSALIYRKSFYVAAAYRFLRIVRAMH